MHNPRPISTGLIVLAIAAFGCTDDTEKESPGETDSVQAETMQPVQPDESKLPEEPQVPDKMREFDVTAERAAKGETLFATCAGCHGPEAQGKVGQAPRLNSQTFLAAASDNYLFNTIKHGRPGTTMIPWGGTYNDEEIKDIVVYLRHEHQTKPAELDRSPLKGDVETGKKLFADICAACHGVHGAGFQETAVGTGIGRKGFVARATNGFIRYILEHGKSGTAMRPMHGAKTSVANLSEKEIDSIIQYLRETAW